MTGGILFLCFPAVKSTNVVGLLVEQLHHTAMEVGGKVSFLTKTSEKKTSKFDFRYMLQCIVCVSIQIWVSV